MFRYDVLCVGSAVVDHFLITEEKLSEMKLGDKLLVRRMDLHTGGGAVNVAAGLSRLGLKVKILTKLGSDHNAHFLQSDFQKYGIKNLCKKHSIKNSDYSTIVSSEQEKDRLVFAYKGASQDLAVEDLPFMLNVKWIYLSSLVGKAFQTVSELARRAQKKKILLFFNPSLYLVDKGKNYLRSILAATTLLVLNLEEAQALLRTKKNNPKDLLLALHHLGPKTVVVTNGAKRLFAFHENHIFSLDPPNVKVVQTLGAGDAFNSGLLAGILNNYSFEDALRLGQLNSTSVIGHFGAKTGLLSEEEAKKMQSKIKIVVKTMKVNK